MGLIMGMVVCPCPMAPVVMGEGPLAASPPVALRFDPVQSQTHGFSIHGSGEEPHAHGPCGHGQRGSDKDSGNLESVLSDTQYTLHASASSTRSIIEQSRLAHPEGSSSPVYRFGGGAS